MRAAALLEALSGMRASVGFVTRVRRRAARKLIERFLPHLQALLASAPVLHAREPMPQIGINGVVRVLLHHMTGGEQQLIEHP